jgi:hypothetical protein
MIDNRNLVQVFGWDETLLQLKDNLHRNVDFVCVTPRCWVALAAWYGSNSPIARHVISLVKGDAALGGGSPFAETRKVRSAETA